MEYKNQKLSPKAIWYYETNRKLCNSNKATVYNIKLLEKILKMSENELLTHYQDWIDEEIKKHKIEISLLEYRRNNFKFETSSILQNNKECCTII